MNKKSKHREYYTDEIDLVKLIKVLWFKRRSIIKVTIVCGLLGIIISFSSAEEYEATCKVMPEIQDGSRNINGLSGLAGLAGLEIGLGTKNSLTPNLYPEIVKSIPFLIELIHSPIKFEQVDSVMSSYVYFKEFGEKSSLVGWVKKYTIGLPSQIMQLFNDRKNIREEKKQDGEILRLSKEDWSLIKSYKNRVNISVENGTGIITISTTMPDPNASAELADLLVKQLTKKVTEYKVEKARTNLSFIQERFDEAKLEYKGVQKRLAKFTDKNKNITSSLVQTEYNSLQNEANIAFEVYKGLASQLEQAKIKVKEETPVFTILEPARVPVYKASPKRKLIIAIMIFAGLAISSIFILLKDSFIKMKE